MSYCTVDVRTRARLVVPCACDFVSIGHWCAPLERTADVLRLENLCELVWMLLLVLMFSSVVRVTQVFLVSPRHYEACAETPSSNSTVHAIVSIAIRASAFSVMSSVVSVFRLVRTTERMLLIIPAEFLEP